MNKLNDEAEDSKLRALLRRSRPAPALPPRFQENVWRRIDASERHTPTFNWLESRILRLLRPAPAFALATALVVTGAFLGVRHGTETARQDAHARYVAAVAPSALH